MNETLEQRLARIGAEAEAGETDQTIRPIPPEVEVTVGAARTETLQVRLTKDERSSIERVAARRGLRGSTFARQYLLGLVEQDRLGVTDLGALADDLLDLATRLRSAVALIEPTPDRS